MVFFYLWEIVCAEPDNTSTLSPHALLHHRNFIRCQPVQLVHQRIDPDINRIDILLDEPLLLIGFSLRQISVEIQHLRNKRNHLIVASDICGGTMNGGRTYRKKYRARNSIQRIEVIV